MKLQQLLSFTRKAVDEYDMIQEGDKIAVGISGGKDSLTLLYARTADEPGGDATVYQVVQDVQTGRILRMERTNGVG